MTMTYQLGIRSRVSRGRKVPLVVVHIKQAGGSSEREWRRPSPEPACS